MAPGFALLIVLAALLLVVVPVLAITAFVHVRQLERDRRAASPENLHRLELRIQGLEKAVERLYARVESAPQSQSQAQSHAPTPSIARPPFALQPPAERIVATSPPHQEFLAPSAPEIPPQRISSVPPNTIPPAAPPAKHIVYTAPHGVSQESEQLENVVAGKWLNYVGIVAVLFAVAFFIEYAFQNNWIGPAGRIAIGIFCGAALLAGSAWLLHRGYEYFSEGIAALGASVLYLSLWGGWHYYNLFTSPETFAGMVIVTAIVTALALHRNSQRLALLALIGGFLTPELISTGTEQQIVLFTYVALLSAGMLALEYFRKWNWLPPLAFAATQIYFWGWYAEFYSSAQLASTLAFALLFFLLFAVLPIARAHRYGRLAVQEYSVAIANVVVFLLALRQILWPDNRWELAFAFLALAAAHLAVLWILPAPSTSPASSAAPFANPAPANQAKDQSASPRWLFVGLALLCASLALPACLDDQWLTIAWAVEGALLVWGGVRAASVWLRAAGLLLFAITAMRLIVLRVPAGQLLWNQRFMTYAVAVACFALGCIFARQIAAQFDEGERVAFAALAVAVNVYALIALSLEIWDFLAPASGFGMNASGGFFAQQLGLSILWTIYATALIIIGMARRAAILRWQALTLFGIVVVKVFFFDLSQLSRFYRILSFLVLGILLLAVSFLYQRRAAPQKQKPS